MTGNELLALTTATGVLLAVCRPARRLAWAILRGITGGLLALVALAVEQHRTRRHELPPPPHQPPAPRPARQPPPVPRCWRVRLSTRIDGFPVVIADGTVVGPWTTAAQVRDEALRRLAEAGHPGERVYAEAWPVTGADTTAGTAQRGAA